MENQKESSGSYFGPRQHMATRSKAANGSRRRRKSRFRSQRMNKIAKDVEKWKVYMLPNTRNRDDRGGVGVTSNAHMRSGKPACGSDKKDQDGNIVSPQAKTVPPMDSREEQSSDVLLVKKNCLIPLVDTKFSNPSRVKNLLPSKELENPTPLLPKEGSNTKLRYQKLSHFRNRTSHPIDAEVMAKLGHRAKDNDALNNEDDTLSSKSNGRSSHTQGQDINVKRHTKEVSKNLASEPLVPNEYDSNEYKARRDEAMNVKDIEAETRMFGSDPFRHQANKKRKKEEEKLTTCDNDDSTRVVPRDKLTSRSIKRRRYIPSNEEDEDEDEDEVGACDKNLMGVHASIGLTPEAAILNDFVERQCDYCSKPISEPAWGGIFKIDGKEYISLVGHLSTKSCEKVWKLSKSLPPMVEVEIVSRLVVWPRIWKASEPSSDNIGLYFLPPNMRHGEELDQLVNEVMKNDLVLRAIINEAEMLIFPSVLLPKRYQMFQAKYYLWAVFKRREDKGGVLAEPLDGTRNQQIKK